MSQNKALNFTQLQLTESNSKQETESFHLQNNFDINLKFSSLQPCWLSQVSKWRLSSFIQLISDMDVL